MTPFPTHRLLLCTLLLALGGCHGHLSKAADGGPNGGPEGRTIGPDGQVVHYDAGPTLDGGMGNFSLAPHAEWPPPNRNPGVTLCSCVESGHCPSVPDGAMPQDQRRGW